MSIADEEMKNGQIANEWEKYISILCACYKYTDLKALLTNALEQCAILQVFTINWFVNSISPSWQTRGKEKYFMTEICEVLGAITNDEGTFLWSMAVKIWKVKKKRAITITAFERGYKIYLVLWSFGNRWWKLNISSWLRFCIYREKKSNLSIFEGSDIHEGLQLSS